MKLHFYFLEHDYYNTKAGIKYAEREVIEKPKTYYPKDRFPDGFYGSFIRKEDIGHIIGLGNNIIILNEKDDEKAKEIFLARYKVYVNEAEKRLNKYREIIDVINKFEVE